MVATWFLGLALGAVGFPEAPNLAPDRASYEQARARAGRDADGQVELALWCEARGLTAERLTHLTRAVLLDSDHEKARGLLGYVRHEGRWMRPDEVTSAIEDSPERQALFREYLERRAKARDHADDQYKLALWCEENGLERPMTAHLHRVIQLDPGREGARRRLGFKKVGGRWVDPEAEAALKSAREAQAQADKEWRARLEKARDALSGRDRKKRDEALAQLAAIDDPRAVPTIWRLFARDGDAGRQRLAIDVLGRIEAPSASVALALIAVYSPHADLRSDAAAVLLRRDARDFAGMLAGLLQDEIKYHARPVDGPGTPGELFVEGRDANVRRRYSPLQGAPPLAPGDWLDRDEFGRVVAMRPTGQFFTGGAIGTLQVGPNGERVISSPSSPDFDGAVLANGMLALPTRTTANLAAGFQAAGLSASQSQDLLGRLSQSSSVPVAGNAIVGGRLEQVMAGMIQIPVEQMLAEAKASALMARRQMEADVRQIEAQNAPIRETNDRVVAVLRRVSEADLGDDREKWLRWAVDLEGYALPYKSPPGPTPTYVEEVPIAFQPQATLRPTVSLLGLRISHSCFAAGTMVRTLRGPRPIETIQPGDLVLAQDTTTGKLDYRPVVTVFHNPKNETLKIDLGREAVHPTGIHRFWKAGHGWIMARDVAPGDRLRGVGGVVEVVAVEEEPSQPVFNLLVAGADNYCVGETRLVAHDNSRVELVEKPFDGVPSIASSEEP